jgi:DNA-binding response OmpR family regulator
LAILSSVPVPSPLEDRPTVLSIGRGEPMLDAVALALDRHGVQFDVGDPANPVQSVFVNAPDLVLLVGDASVEDGRAVLEKLAATVATAVIPVAILSNDAGLDQRLQAARFGAVALVPRTASADAMATQIAEIARELPERKTEAATDLGEASLDEVVELFARRLRSGILAVSASGGTERVVLRGDRPVTQAIEELVDRLRPLVTQSDTVHWEFQQASTGKLAELTLDDEPSGMLDLAALFRDRRLVIVEKSPARADDLVVALRERGAHVVVIDGEGTGLAKARAIDPDLILVDVSGVGGWASQAMQLIRTDPRLRWAALLVTRGEELWRSNTPEPDVSRLAAGMLPLVEPDESLMQRVREMTEPLDVRLETTGPTRFLRSVARARTTVHATVRHRRGSIEIDLAEGLVVGARGEVLSEIAGAPSTKVEGSNALAVWLALGAGRVRIEKRDAPSVANVMSPVDDAIAAADRETPVLVPSMPPPAGPPSIRPPTPATGITRPPTSGQTDARALVTQLESLLDRLRHTLPPGSLEVPSETAAALAAAKGPTPPRKDPTPAVVPAPARVPQPTAKPALRRATQIGVPVPPLTKPGAGPPPKKVVPPPPPDEVEPPTAKRAQIPEEPPTTKRAVVEEPLPIAPLPVEPAPVVVAPEPPPIAPLPIAPPPVFAPSREIATEPAIPSPASAPLEVTDQVVLPPARPEPDEVVAIPGARSRGSTWLLVVVALLVALLLVAAAGAWRMGLFTRTDVASIPLTTVPPTIAAPPTIAPPTSVAEVAPPTSVAEVAPTSVAELAPPTSVAEVAPPPTTVAEVIPPPTTVAEVIPPPTTVAEVAPPPSEVDDTADTTDDTSETPAARVDEAQRLVDRANFLRSHGDLPGAEADYLRVLRISPNNARAMAGLARLHLARHDARTASTWARRLAEGHLPNAGNYVLLGDALQASGDTAGARRAWERALEITPGYRDARRRLGR